VKHSTVGAQLTFPVVCKIEALETKFMKIRAIHFFLASSIILAFAELPTVAQETMPGPSVVASQHVTDAIAPKPLDFHEDMGSITLQSSNLLKIDAVLGIKDGAPEGKFTRELWQVSWRGGDPIDLYILRPTKVAKPPVILYLYSYPDGTDRFNNPQWCEGVVSRGYAAVGFVSAYTGHRLEYHAPKKWFVSELPESLATTTHDVQMILNFLASLGDLDMDRVGMFGEGSGGSIAILASAADPRIKALQVLGAWGDWPDWLAQSKMVPEEERATYLKPEFQKSVAPLDPVLWLPKVKAESVRVENVETYRMVPQICERKIEAAAPKNAQIDDFGDSRAMLLRMSSEGELFGWLKTQLQPDAQRSAHLDDTERIHHYPPAGPPAQSNSLMASPSSAPAGPQPSGGNRNPLMAPPPSSPAPENKPSAQP
jgi:acetyl esterase/lipase